MSERIITLFGEEVIPEQLKAVGKSRAKKKTTGKEEDSNDDAPKEEEPSKPEIVQATLSVFDIPAAAPPQEQPQVMAAPPAATDAVVTEDELPVNNSIDTIPAEEPQVKPAKAKKDEKKPENLPEDWSGEKQYYSIGEVADLFKVKTSHIRFWTNEFKLKVRTTRKGDRLYTPAQIKELRAIHHLVKERGFTLTGAKAKLKTQNNLDVETVDLKQSLLQLRNKLMAIKNQLK